MKTQQQIIDKLESLGRINGMEYALSSEISHQRETIKSMASEIERREESIAWLLELEQELEESGELEELEKRL